MRKQAKRRAKGTGSLVWMPSGWHGRYWAVVDGERVQKFESLNTKNELLANRELDRLIAISKGDAAPTAQETFEQAAKRVLALRARMVPNAHAEERALALYAFGILGRIPVRQVSKKDVLSVLENVRDKGRSRQTILHVRNAFAAVYRVLRREGVIEHSPMPSTDELPECLPEAINDKPKAILSDDELLCYLTFTEPREGERFRAPVRERQLMALFSRCVGGMRSSELHGLTWSRVAAESGRFDQIEVVRYKVRRKAAKRGNKSLARQVYPLGDTRLPLFLRFWYVRTALKARAFPDHSLPLFPVRRARRSGEIDRVGETRAKGASWAAALRRDVGLAFEAGHARGDSRAPAKGSQRWRELLEGTEDRRALLFHSTRNMAAVAVERFERLKASARFTGHASVSMLQHYRERAGEVDVVPVVPELLPDADVLEAIVRLWCEAERIPQDLVFGDANDCANRLCKLLESPQISTNHSAARRLQTPDLIDNQVAEPCLEGRCSIQLSYGGKDAETTACTRLFQVRAPPSVISLSRDMTQGREIARLG